MTTATTKTDRKLRELEAELLERQIVATLEFTPAGIAVKSPNLADKLLAKKHLRGMGMKVL